MQTTHRWIFGNTHFSKNEEYDEFRYKLLIVLMLSAALCTGLFVAGELTRLNRITPPHLYAMQAFAVLALILWWLLRGHRSRYKTIAWAYEAICLLEFASALWFVPADELRMLWFFVNIPGVFILLGARAGWTITLMSISWIHLSNSWNAAAYSSNAMATATFSMLYLGVFFHAYGARSLSYFTRMRENNAQLELLATHDMLTGVLNTRAYYSRCEGHIKRAQRTGQPFAVLFVDLDHFKKINDTYGHDAGDVVLKAVATCLQANVRASDCVGRVGGEEFSLFMPDTPKAGALQLAQSILKAVAALRPVAGSMVIPVTASIGVASSGPLDESMQDIQRRADQAMYLAKSAGRNRVSELSSDAHSKPSS